MSVLLWLPLFIAVGGIAYLCYFIWSLNHSISNPFAKAPSNKKTQIIELNPRKMTNDYLEGQLEVIGPISPIRKRSATNRPSIKITKSEIIIANTAENLSFEDGYEQLARLIQTAKYEEPIILENQYEVSM